MRADTITILRGATRGDVPSAQQLSALLYGELHEMAERQFRRETPGHTLQPTAIVHEALIRLLGPDDVPALPFNDRTHFLAVAANTMRRVLIDHARKRRAQKRGGDAHRITLTDAGTIREAPALDLLALEDAMAKLQSLNERQARVVEMRFFSGMSEPEIAATLGISERTARGDWLHARVWLRRELGEAPDQP